MKEKKYEFTGNTTMYNGIILYQIRAVKDFYIFDTWYHYNEKCHVHVGDIGGWISDEDCLAQDDNSWIHPSAKIIYSTISEEVYIGKNTIVYNSEILSDRFSAFAGCGIFNHNIYCEDSFICRMQIGGKDRGRKSSKRDYELAEYVGVRCLSSRVKLELLDFCNVVMDIPLFGDAPQYNKFLGKQYITASNTNNYKTLLKDICLRVDCHISRPEDILRIEGIGSRCDTVIFVKSYDETHINVQTGCFGGTVDEFIDAVKKTHKNNPFFIEEYMMAVEIAKHRILRNDQQRNPQ